MPDEQTLPILPPDVTPSWLARNRKLAILGGAVVVLLIAAAATYYWPRWQSKSVANSNTTTADVNVENDAINGAPTNTYSRPTFQRSIITNVSTSPPPDYQPPTTAQTKQAIDQLNSVNKSSP